MVRKWSRHTEPILDMIFLPKGASYHPGIGTLPPLEQAAAAQPLYLRQGNSAPNQLRLVWVCAAQDWPSGAILSLAGQFQTTLQDGRVSSLTASRPFLLESEGELVVPCQIIKDTIAPRTAQRPFLCSIRDPNSVRSGVMCCDS